MSVITAVGVEEDGVAVPLPDLPLGRRVELPGRGTTFVREVAGPPGAPTVILLHGLTASGGLNWFQAFGPLGRHYRVLAIDHRGHGRGLRTRRRFTLADCADDVAALMDVEGIGEAIAVGYSMGGPIAQLLWKRHPEKVAGLVLCATSDRFVPGRREQLVFVTAMGAVAGTTRLGDLVTRVPVGWFQNRVPAGVRTRPETFRRWARAEMRRHDWRMVAEATGAIGNYDASRWIGDIDVPTAVLITTEDKAVAPIDQARLALRIPTASMHKVDDGHIVCAKPRFGGVLRRVVDDVARQVASGTLVN
ncbi:MAG TPA: alpha/beta hydrolase [Acidimicrobiales bacterium]|jgi:pimeloyl-ACP methyl ester carboxylesterase|nr:alpha/beta hydrolase [Acidimicrobiales bacterium]